MIYIFLKRRRKRKREAKGARSWVHKKNVATNNRQREARRPDGLTVMLGTQTQAWIVENLVCDSGEETHLRLGNQPHIRQGQAQWNEGTQRENIKSKKKKKKRSKDPTSRFNECHWGGKVKVWRQCNVLETRDKRVQVGKGDL